MAFFEITVYTHARLFRGLDSIEERTHPIEPALSRARIVISMMATSKHPFKRQDELSSAVRKRLPYIWQGFPLDNQRNPYSNQQHQKPRARALHDINQRAIQ
ncbi:hypothetical protein C4K25_5992 [Pseudomonas chlororaphis]|nr:hypothetical protein C4K25_5992 [Pseudomonas chlororaphis]